MKKKKNVIMLLICLCIPFLFSMNIHAAAGMNVAFHSQNEIRQMYRKLNIQTNQATSYEIQPLNQAPYRAGKVSSSVLQNGINTLNMVRYIAGIPYNVQIEANYQELAQGAALINCVQGYLSHYPSKISDMDDTLFDICYRGSSSSNLAKGYRNLYSAIVDGWMADDDSGNIDRVGHRRWCLNPPMQYTGLGVDGNCYSMYAFNRSGKESYYGVAWPAQNMPLEFVSWNGSGRLPWSISMGTSVDPASVKVELKRINDGRTWKFSRASADGYFNVNNNGYGQVGAIIFRPDGISQYQEGDTYQVSVTGTGINVSYSVNFFWIHDHQGGSATCQKKARCSVCGNYYGSFGEHQYKQIIEKKATCTEAGKKCLKCSLCGKVKDGSTQVIPATGHTRGKADVTEPTCAKDGEKRYTCVTCRKTKTEKIAATGKHQGGSATCQKKARCSVCGNEYGELGAHKYKETVQKKATCTEAGKKYLQCSQCGKVKDGSTEMIPATGHTWGKADVTEPTCAKDGEKRYTCATCRKTKTEKIAATGKHQGGSATCQKKAKCSVCGNYYGSFGEHQYKQTVEKKATCTEAGKKCLQCSQCGKVKDGSTEVIPATGHTWGKAKVTNPTCVADGFRKYTCANCKQTKTEIISSSGHQWSEWSVLSEATVFSPKIHKRTCSVCRIYEKQNVGTKLKPKIKLNYTSLTLKVGQSTSVVKISGLASGDSVKAWKSSNSQIVKVDSKGKITAQKSAGKATVTVTLASKLTAKIQVTVQKSTVKTKQLTGLKASLTLKKGQKMALKPVRNPVTATEKITYSSSNTKIVTVNSSGIVQAKAAGTAKIVVKSGTAKFVVTINVPKTKTTSISNVKKDVTIKRGGTYNLKPKLVPANSDETIIYSSSDKKVATVTSGGVIKGIKKGKATITVKSGRISAICTVTVK